MTIQLVQTTITPVDLTVIVLYNDCYQPIVEHSLLLNIAAQHCLKQYFVLRRV